MTAGRMPPAALGTAWELLTAATRALRRTDAAPELVRLTVAEILRQALAIEDAARNARFLLQVAIVLHDASRLGEPAYEPAPVLQLVRGERGTR